MIFDMLIGLILGALMLMLLIFLFFCGKQLIKAMKEMP